MFMMEKALVVMIFMYAFSFAFLGVQFVLADTFNFTMRSPVTGQVMSSNVLNYTHMNTLNQIQGNVSSTTRTDVVSNAFSFLSMVWELLQIITGTYIFNILGLLGVPPIIIMGITVIYLLLMVRAFFGYIRGI